MKRSSACAALVVCLSSLVASASAEEYVLADGKSWPGRLLVHRSTGTEVFHIRPGKLPDEVVPRVQSVTLLGSRVVFCSGLDRMLFERGSSSERLLRDGGYLARQVRTDEEGVLYWSGLETPLGGNPLPDGVFYSWNPRSGEAKTVLTFSQGDVGRDWWGAFDVRAGRIYIATLSGQSRLYDVTTAPVQHVATLPISATAFRFGPQGQLLACDGKGKLYRFDDLAHTDRHSVVLRSDVPFVDFAVRP